MHSGLQSFDITSRNNITQYYGIFKGYLNHLRSQDAVLNQRKYCIAVGYKNHITLILNSIFSSWNIFTYIILQKINYWQK